MKQIIFNQKENKRNLLSEFKRCIWILCHKENILRTSEYVNNLYQKIYSSSNAKNEKEGMNQKYEYILGDKIITVNKLWAREYYIDLINEWIKKLSVKNILEVGSGRGINLFNLLEINKELLLTGLEKSSQGVKRGREKNIELKKNVSFIEGDALKLPFSDDSFDLAFTMQVLEQIPHDYPTVVKEMARVSKYSIYIEEFKEAQSIADRIWLWKKDYFRSSYKKFKEYGIEPLYFSYELPHKLKYSVGLLLTKNEINKLST